MHVVSSENIQWKSLVNESGNGRLGLYIGMPGTYHAGPQAFLVQVLDPGGRIRPHFHDVDQFQVIVEGDGAIGKQPLHPVTAQYADAYTPYGPIVAKDHGLSFFTLRQCASSGLFVMPGSKSKMPGRAGRNLAARFVTGEIPPVGSEVIRVPLAEADDGLQIIGLRLATNQKATAMPVQAGGQYLLVCGGALIHEGLRLPPHSLLYVEAGEATPVLQAGPLGAEVLIMQFPKPSARPGSDPHVLAQRAATDYVLPSTIRIE